MPYDWNTGLNTIGNYRYLFFFLPSWKEKKKEKKKKESNINFFFLIRESSAQELDLTGKWNIHTYIYTAVTLTFLTLFNLKLEQNPLYKIEYQMIWIKSCIIPSCLKKKNQPSWVFLQIFTTSTNQTLNKNNSNSYFWVSRCANSFLIYIISYYCKHYFCRNPCLRRW